MLNFRVKTGTRFSRLAKRLFEISEVEITRVDCIGYNMNVRLQTAGMVSNPVMVDSVASLFNCSTVSRISD